MHVMAPHIRSRRTVMMSDGDGSALLDSDECEHDGDDGLLLGHGGVAGECTRTIVSHQFVLGQSESVAARPCDTPRWCTRGGMASVTGVQWVPA